ncbi:hypothetical protein LR48_Vigan07g162200 [Vigna angularis]|uniref:BEACH domain-containing protein n=1 Tax=Phaseolus angularis TaxID=3914 RepID=A0A0L9UYQ7_PHAAN|nr:hypothetical protein LR48_Vigan07g162200 [Vigna angularis]
MADANGQISAAVIEKLAAAAAADPYESVSSAFVSYGSCAKDLAIGWKYRSRLWYGVGLSSNTASFGGGGSGWEFWKSLLDKDDNGNWLELPLVKKSVAMLQALLLDESGKGGGLGIGGGSGTGMGAMTALYQLLDSDQPFLCMLRMVLLSMREDDDGIDSKMSEERKLQSALLWSVLSPILNMPISDAKKQRVLVACCVIYSEASLDLISPVWAAAFASPPAALALSMIAAGTSDSENHAPSTNPQLRRETSLLERKQARLQTFSSFQKPSTIPNKTPPIPKNKAAAKDAALAAARDVQRFSRIGSGRGLSAVAMATSTQRRTAGDMERVQRWNITEAMGVAWMECLQPVDTKSIYEKDFNALSYKFIAVLVASFALARNMQRSEMDRHVRACIISRHRISIGIHAWRKLIRQLIEMRSLFGPFADYLYNPYRVFWKLDFMESSSRMRRCMRRNYRGSDHLGSAANYEDYSRENNDPSTRVLSAEAITVEGINEEEEHIETENLDLTVDDIGDEIENQPKFSKGAEKTLQNSSDSNGIQPESDEGIVQSSSAFAPGYVPSELDERIVIELPSTMVQPLRVVQGTFQVTSRRINFIVDNNETSTMMDGLKFGYETRDQEKNHSWLISTLHQIYSRRYLLRRSALEIFMVDRSNFFFDFGSRDGRRNAYQAIVHARPLYLNNIYLATQRPGLLLKRTQLMERWARWEISNFEYLMQLNTLAGRSYNDITQYPVFPWILSDYSSKSLDLSNPSSYRDLSKPIGALNPDRLKKFQERYSSFDDPVIPKFHYGSHYSSAGTIECFLIFLLLGMEFLRT